MSLGEKLIKDSDELFENLKTFENIMDEIISENKEVLEEFA